MGDVPQLTLATAVAADPMSSPSMKTCMVSSPHLFTPTRFPTWAPSVCVLANVLARVCITIKVHVRTECVASLTTKKR